VKSDNQLAKRFLDCRPNEAALVLENLTAQESAALLSRVPARLAAPVLNHMLYPNAVAIITLLQAEKMEALVSLLSNTCVAALLRSLPTKTRQQQLKQLPRIRAKFLQLMLNYPATSVGAWMKPQVFTLPENSLVGQALNRIRHTTQSLQHKAYVLDREQHLSGEIPLPQLLQQPENTAIASLAQPVTDKLRARASLASVVDDPGWGRNTALPVVDHQRRFLGCLQLATLHHALKAQAVPVAASDTPPARDGLSNILWQATLSALQVGMQLVTTDREIQP
jgi:magnesium transporter